eukprot:1147211-Pelagomonas_calceolata.AAC.4
MHFALLRILPCNCVGLRGRLCKKLSPECRTCSHHPGTGITLARAAMQATGGQQTHTPIIRKARYVKTDPQIARRQSKRSSRDALLEPQLHNSYSSAIHPQTSMLGAAVHPHQSMLAAAVHPQASMLGAAVHPQASMLGAAVHPHQSMLAAAVHPHQSMLAAAVQSRQSMSAAASRPARTFRGSPCHAQPPNLPFGFGKVTSPLHVGIFLMGVISAAIPHTHTN